MWPAGHSLSTSVLHPSLYEKVFLSVALFTCADALQCSCSFSSDCEFPAAAPLSSILLVTSFCSDSLTSTMRWVLLYAFVCVFPFFSQHSGCLLMNGGFCHRACGCSDKVFSSIAGQRRGSVALRAEEPLLRVSLHAVGRRGLRDCPHHGTGLRLRRRLPLSVDVRVSLHWRALWTHSRAVVHRRCAHLLHTAFHVLSLPSRTGCLRTLTSTAAWSTWATWDTPSWLSRSHRRLPSQVCLSGRARPEMHVFSPDSFQWNCCCYIFCYKNVLLSLVTNFLHPS